MFDATCSHLDAIIVSSRRLHTLLFNLRDGRRDHCLPRRVNDGLGIGHQCPVCGEQLRVFGGAAALDFDHGVHKFPTGIC